MILLAIACVWMVAASEILVRREQNYDTVVWDGDCSRINANYTGKTCICQKTIIANEIRTELPGFFYPSADGFGTCLYDYRETGNHFSLEIIFGTPFITTLIAEVETIPKPESYLEPSRTSTIKLFLRKQFIAFSR